MSHVVGRVLVTAKPGRASVHPIGKVPLVSMTVATLSSLHQRDQATTQLIGAIKSVTLRQVIAVTTLQTSFVRALTVLPVSPKAIRRGIVSIKNSG